MDGLADFFTNYIFSPNRRVHVGAVLSQAEERTAVDHQTRIEAVRNAIRDLEKRRQRLVHQLETSDDIDEALMRDIKARSAELGAEQAAKRAELAKLEGTQPPHPSPELLDLLPAGPIDFHALPEQIRRDLFEAFHLEMRYDLKANRASCRVTIAGPVLDLQSRTAQGALQFADSHGGTGEGNISVCRICAQLGRTP
jgi:site-specific DNA recombinase